MATLVQLRTALNGDIGVTTDTESLPWSKTVRNQAIAFGYAALWTAGVWKFYSQDIPAITGQQSYSTLLRELHEIQLVDSSGVIQSYPIGVINTVGGTSTLFLRAPVSSTYTIRARGFLPYISDFLTAGAFDDTKTDDLEAEFMRVPLLKAKSILYGAQLATFVRFSGRQAAPPALNLSVEQMYSIRSLAEREWETETKRIAGQRPRISQAAMRRPL
jgi:hypothetical protein